MKNPSRPQLHASQWFNTAKPIQLDALRGRVVAIHTFQMLCPGCVAHGLPQAVRLRDSFADDQIAVIGLHTVFEHHSVMGPDALAAFIHEYRLSFPIGVDEASSNGPIPKTMASWGLQVTPSLVLLDRDGQVRLSHFGRIDGIALGVAVGRLSEQRYDPGRQSCGAPIDEGCDSNSCRTADAARHEGK
jgi:hypothetical protein